MKRLLLGASVCLGLFAFTMNSSSRNHSIASAGYRSLMSDTTKPKDTTKPTAVMPNYASADYRSLLSDTTKPKDTTKPNANMLAVLTPGHGR